MTFNSTVESRFDSLRACGIAERDIAMYETGIAKSPGMNMKFRRRCVEAGYADHNAAHELWMLCSRDALFFFNTFGWLLEARAKQDWNLKARYGTSNVIPFITRGYQDRLIMECIENLGRNDIVVTKSRETGISWIMCALAVWDWTFHDQTHIGFVSKDLLSANNPDDPDALFSKFEFMLKRLPYWMLSPSDYERNISKNTFRNNKNMSSITAYAAKSDIGRGGRKAWMLMDEFHFFDQGDDYAALDSTVHVTPCRVFVSTANRDRGMAGAFYDVHSDEHSNGVHVDVDWKDDPEKRRGLYHGELIPGTETYRVIIDDMDFWREYCNFDGKGTYRHPNKPGENYPFIADERKRSLYYDHVWGRPGSTPQSVAAELDKNFGGATAQIFNPGLLTKLIDSVNPPVMTGDIVRDPENLKSWIFEKLAVGGLTTFWCELENGKPPKSEYIIGADVSAGTGGEWSSYSALEVLDRKTGDHVFEWRSNRIDPIQFAELTVWVCKLFHNAYLIPEVNGPLGQLFINKVVKDLKYFNIYHEMKQRVAHKEPTERIGYLNSDRGIALLKQMESLARAGRIHPNSLVALKECGRYFMKNGKLVHSAAETTEDGAGMGLAHGDAAIALGCAAHGIDQSPEERKAQEAKKEAPVGSFLWRRQQYEKALKKGNRSYWNPIE